MLKVHIFHFSNTKNPPSKKLMYYLEEITRAKEHYFAIAIHTYIHTCKGAVLISSAKPINVTCKINT